MPLPLLPIVIAALASGGASAAGSIASRKNTNQVTKAELEKAKMEDLLARDLQTQKLSAEEGMADPFRNLLAQINAASQFDQIANDTPLNVDFSGNPYEKYIPKVTGGYTPSEELRTGAATGRTAALQGQGRAPSVANPSMNDPATTSILNLLNSRGTLAPPVSNTMPVSGKMPITPGPMAPTAMPPGLTAPVADAPTDFDLSIQQLLAESPSSSRPMRPTRRARRRTSMPAPAPLAA